VAAGVAAASALLPPASSLTVAVSAGTVTVVAGAGLGGAGLEDASESSPVLVTCERVRKGGRRGRDHVSALAWPGVRRGLCVQVSQILHAI
jgi:hypothetical protein